MSVARPRRALSCPVVRKSLALLVSGLVITHAHADDTQPAKTKVLEQVHVTAASPFDLDRTNEASTGALGLRD